MSLSETLTQKTHQQFIKTISDQHYAMPGVVIAASATQAVALGEACMQISFDNQVDRLDWQDVNARIERMVHIKESLLAWVDQNADVAAKHGNLVDAGQQPPNARVFFEGPAELARLSLLAVNTLTEFHPLAFQQLQENIWITVELLHGCARA
ncbi:MAG: hypothetical protein R3264_16085, partial [Anaerolineae bacterium]|nr:hypothetical protein [Anaerolineae bacterium]